MVTKAILMAILAAACCAAALSAGNPARAAGSAGPPPGVGNLRCEYLENPLGIDTVRPRLSWIVTSERRGERQAAYQVLVASSPTLLDEDKGDLWDSGKIASAQSIQVEYAGAPLTSRRRCFWKVRIWDQDGRAAWSGPSTWMMGLMDPADWKARWIAAEPDGAVSQDSSTFGYHAAEAASADQVKWVQVDLGRSIPIEAVKLHPMDHDGKPGFGFPLRFTVAASDDPEFKTGTTIVDQAAADYPNPGHVAVPFDGKGTTARYVRVTALKLWNRETGANPYCFALAELEVFSNHKNTALHAPVSALDSVEAFGWGKSQLTDGQGLAPESGQPKSAFPGTSLPIFRQTFDLDKPVERATAYVCGLGEYEMHLNGKIVGDSLLDPGWTNYRKTCLYRTYDATGMIRQGANAIGVMLGNGMYHVSGPRYTKFLGSFGQPKLIAQIEITFADGTSKIIGTDDRWTVAPGPITFSSIYGGEDYDARLEQPGWDGAAFAAKDWLPVAVTAGPGGRLVGSSQSAPPIKIMKVFQPVQKTKIPTIGWLFDLGQNCSMMPRITVTGPAGAHVTIRTGEKFEGDHFVGGTSNMATFNYVLKGGGAETWAPRFTYVGARYLLVQGAEPAGSPVDALSPQIQSIDGLFVCGSAAPAGEFSCSSDLFNRTAEIIRWAMRSNMVSILTDCPHRERLGWLEQDHLVGPSLMYSYDLPVLFTKITGDMADAQLDDGMVPDIAPEYVVFSGGFRDSPEWGSAYVLIPWNLYRWYGDVSILRKHYEGMQRYVAYLDSKAKDHIVSHGLADWYAIQGTNTPQVATAFYYLDIKVLENTARLLEKPLDAEKYAALAAQVREAYNTRFYDGQNHRYAGGTQTGNALPVVTGIADPANSDAVVADIVRDIRKRGNALTAGDVGYRYLLRSLADHGRSDVIFDMNSGSDHPGYGMMLAKGNTSLPEAWDGNPGSSLNHFMLGHIMEWFYSDLSGIQCDPGDVAFKKIVIKPAIVGDITWASASYNSPYGKINSSWKRDAAKLTLEVTIPVGSTATVFLPTGDAAKITESGHPVDHAEGVKLLRTEGGFTVFEIASGRYRFEAQRG